MALPSPYLPSRAFVATTTTVPRFIAIEVVSETKSKSNSETKSPRFICNFTLWNVHFTEASLAGVAPLMQKVHSEICVVDTEILAAVRQQSNSGTKAKEDLAAATRAVEELMYKVREIKTKAEQSETMVQEICRDIKKLDFAKEHITTTITALHRLTMLGTGKETEDSSLLQHLTDACLVVDALELSVREELVKNFCDRELISYQQIFEGAELAKLDKTERRYAWVKRRLRTNEEIWKIFPSSWNVDYLPCIQFCKLTRSQLEDILENLKEKPDVGTLLMALQRTIEFEEELAEKFGRLGEKIHSPNVLVEESSVLNLGFELSMFLWSIKLTKTEGRASRDTAAATPPQLRRSDRGSLHTSCIRCNGCEYGCWLHGLSLAYEAGLRDFSGQS
ncbi:hypothetical protein LXL04_003792 [Taraxacum kok-saghyz]